MLYAKGIIKNLDHLCVSLALSDGTLLMISPIAKVEDHYYSSKFAKFDFGLSDKLYKGYSFYSWKDGTLGPYKEQADTIKEEVYNLYSGHFVSEKIGDCYLIFGIASYCKDPRMTTIFMNNIDTIRQAGMYFYMRLRSKLQEHTDKVLPLVDAPAKLNTGSKIVRLRPKDERGLIARKGNIILPGESNANKRNKIIRLPSD